MFADNKNGQEWAASIPKDMDPELVDNQLAICPSPEEAVKRTVLWREQDFQEHLLDVTTEGVKA